MQSSIKPTTRIAQSIHTIGLITNELVSGCVSGIDNQMEVGEDAKEDSTSADKKRVVNGLMPDQIASIVRCVLATLFPQRCYM